MTAMQKFYLAFGLMASLVKDQCLRYCIFCTITLELVVV